MNIQRIKERYEEELLRNPNIVGVGIGEKIVKGVSIKRQCIKVYVRKKLPVTKLRKGELIPQELGGIETDVEEIGKITAQGNSGRYRPAPGGVSLGHYKITAGTLGC